MPLKHGQKVRRTLYTCTAVGQKPLSLAKALYSLAIREICLAARLTDAGAFLGRLPESRRPDFRCRPSSAPALPAYVKGPTTHRPTRVCVDLTTPAPTLIWAWFKKVPGTVVRSTRRAVPATVPGTFLNHALIYDQGLPTRHLAAILRFEPDDVTERADKTSDLQPADRLI